MKRILSILITLTMLATITYAQQPQRINLGDATSAITNTINALNTLYQDLSKADEADAEIGAKIRSISTMAFPCREAVINSSYNVKSMTEDKKATIVTLAQDLETQVTTIDRTASKATILSTLDNAEKKMTQLTKTLGIKTKKNKKK